MFKRKRNARESNPYLIYELDADGWRRIGTVDHAVGRRHACLIFAMGINKAGWYAAFTSEPSVVTEEDLVEIKVG